MKVVILHQHFNTPESGGAIRSWYLGTALVAKGIEVVVVTAHNKSEYIKTMVDGMEVHYLPVPYDNKFGFAERGWSFLQFVWKSVKLISSINDVKICYAISVPLTIGVAAMRIKRAHKIPFIFEVGDLWPDAPVQLGFVRNYFFRKYLYRLEKRIYRNASSIVALSPSIEEAIKTKVPGKTITMIPNMADCDFYQREQKNPAFETKFGVANHFVVSYIGAAGFANGLDYFLECANLARKQSLPVHFILCGDGAVRERLKGHAEKLGLINISFLGLQNRVGVKEVMNVTDAVFVCYKNVPVLETGSPNKFFDGLAAGKLIITNFGGWIKTEIEDSQCGFAVDPQNPADFTRKLRPFLDDDGMLDRFQRSARRLAETKYARTILSEKFAKIFS